MIGPNTMMRDCVVNLSIEEWQQRSEALGLKLEALKEHQNKTKSDAAAAKATEKTLQTEIETLGETIRTHQETRPVECYEQPVPARAYVEIIRTDTHEVIDSRPMTDAERASRQEDFPWMRKPGSEN